MLNPLAKEHKANFGAIENGILRLHNFSAQITPAELIKYCKRSLRGLFIYTFDNEYFDYLINNKFDDIMVKITYAGCEIMFIKLISRRNTITLINAAFFFPKQPKNLYNALFYLYNKLGKGILPCYTPATFALRLWRLKFQKETLRGISSRVDNFVRQAYAGGRSDIIRKKLDKGYYYDINSMYGAMMLKDMPVGHVIYTEKKTKDLIGFYKCEINQTGINLPPLWKKIHNKGKSKDMLCFPGDEFSGVFSGDEIDMAIEAGAKVKINYGIEWEDKSPIFREFIEYIYKLKTETKFEWLEAFLKKVMVSFYGKFAEKKKDYKDIIQCANVKDYYKRIEEDGAKIIDERNITVSQKKKVMRYNKNSYILPHLSAHIAALGRIEIYNQAIRAGNVAYIETDALFCDKKLKTGKKLGDWKLVGKITDAEFFMSKVYRYTMETKDYYVVSGLPEDANRLDYFAGKPVKAYKNQKFIPEKKEYTMKMSNAGFIKRDVYDDYSEPLTVNEILKKMIDKAEFSQLSI